MTYLKLDIASWKIIRIYIHKKALPISIGRISSSIRVVRHGFFKKILKHAIADNRERKKVKGGKATL